MLWAYQLPNVASSSHNTTVWDLASPNYGALSDKKPGAKTLFTPKLTGAQVLVITQNLNTADGWLDFNTFPYPYLLVGVVNIGNYPFEGQLVQGCSITVNGKWGAGGARAGTCLIGPTGYSSFWAAIPASSIVGTTPTTQIVATLGVNVATIGAFGNVGVGEIVIAGADEIPISDLRIDLMDPSRMNRSSGNQPWPVTRRGYRKVTGQVTPQTRADSLGAGTRFVRPLQDTIFQAARNSGQVIAPLWRNPGSVTADTPTLLRNAMMARVVDLPSISGSANDRSFKSALGLEELL